MCLIFQNIPINQETWIEGRNLSLTDCVTKLKSVPPSCDYFAMSIRPMTSLVYLYVVNTSHNVCHNEPLAHWLCYKIEVGGRSLAAILWLLCYVYWLQHRSERLLPSIQVPWFTRWMQIEHWFRVFYALDHVYTKFGDFSPLNLSLPAVWWCFIDVWKCLLLINIYYNRYILNRL